jgi:hypothetical protein
MKTRSQSVAPGDCSISEKPSDFQRHKKNLVEHLTKSETSAFPSGSPLVLSRENSYPLVSFDRATGLVEKTSISINVYGPSSMIEMSVDAEKLAPIVLRLLSDLDTICQDRIVRTIT